MHSDGYARKLSPPVHIMCEGDQLFLAQQSQNFLTEPYLWFREQCHSSQKRKHEVLPRYLQSYSTTNDPAREYLIAEGHLLKCRHRREQVAPEPPHAHRQQSGFVRKNG